MYYAKSLRDILKTTQLNKEFFDGLDEFHIHFVDMCFHQILEDQMGMMTEVELHNYNIFEEFKTHLDLNAIYLDDSWKKTA